MDYDIVIAGAGAAGLMCAIEAAKRGKQVLVIEHSDRAGKKIRISGGGRCNFTNLHTSPDNYVSANPDFCKSALARYTPEHFTGMVEAHEIAYHEKAPGQLFCDGSSKEIVDMLLGECESAGAGVRLNCAVDRVDPAPGGSEHRFCLSLDGERVRAHSLVVATGGLSVPPSGASSWGYEVAKHFDHAVITPRAALVPLTFSGKYLQEYQDLSGVSLPVQVWCEDQSFDGAMLITHRGLSGPSILQVSLYWRPGEGLRINLVPQLDTLGWLRVQQNESPAAELKTVLAGPLPKRLAHRLCEVSLSSRPMRQYSDLELREIGGCLESWPVVPSGTEGYRTAEVTAGGVDTNMLSSTTMESRSVPGLYFIGEVVDVTGQLGGFNFQWAWASGYAAGQAVE